MPYVKPGEMLTVQEMVSEWAEERVERGSGVDRDVVGFMDTCPICGDGHCKKSIVKANGVYVHPEDVSNADEIERPELP